MAYDDADIRAYYNEAVHYGRTNSKNKKGAIPRILMDRPSEPIVVDNSDSKLAKAARISPFVVRKR